MVGDGARTRKVQLTPEAVEEAARAAVVVRTKSSVERGGGPAPGAYSPPFYWPDLLDGDPPRRHARGEGSYVIYHALEVGPDTRLTFSTVVSVSRSGTEGREEIQADSRVGVQNRLFLEFIHRERAFMDRFMNRSRESLVRRLVRQRQIARRLPWRWSRRAALAVVRTEGRIGLWALRSVRKVTQGVVEFPDTVYTRSARAWSHLYGRLGRKTLWADMRDPRNLTTEQKGVVLALTAGLLVATLFILNNVFSLFLPRYAIAYSDIVHTFMWGVATAVVLPFPPSEILVIAPYITAGPVAAFFAIVASKFVGAWFVFFIGDALHTFIERQTTGKPRTKALVDWMKAKSQRFGFWLVALFTAAPFLPDTLALYVFAASGTSFRAYLGGALLGTVIRYGAVIGILVFLGPEQVRAYFG